MILCSLIIYNLSLSKESPPFFFLVPLSSGCFLITSSFYYSSSLAYSQITYGFIDHHWEMKMESDYIRHFYKCEAYRAGANCVCMVEWLNMPWRSFSAFNQSLLVIKTTEIVCVAWCERIDLRLVAFPFAVHRKKRDRKLPLLYSGHRLQLGHVSCLDPNEKVLEEVTVIGILTCLWSIKLYFFFPEHLFFIEAWDLLLGIPIKPHVIIATIITLQI